MVGEDLAAALLKRLERQQPHDEVSILKSPQKLFQIIASDTEIAAVNAEQNSATTTYTKRREIVVLRDGVWRVTFNIHRSLGGGSAEAKIYRSGVAYGVEHQSVSDAYKGTDYTEDLTFQAGDKVQLWCKNTLPSGACYWKDFAVRGTKTTELAEVTM
jgi:hypothetical protein